ncbi:MAG: hypothetical protein ACOYM3_05430 [Terrimicrobiaceae bacterium]
MKTHRTDKGTVFFDFQHADAPLLHSLFSHVLEASPLGGELLSRFCAANYATFYLFDREQADFSALLDSAKVDLSEEMGRGEHDEKIGSTRESELLLEMIGRIRQLVGMLPGEGEVD